MRNVFFLLLMSLITSTTFAQSIKPLPCVEKVNGYYELLVNQQPYLILGGELGNSSTSNLDYMRPIWPKLKSMQLNTALAPVYWELMEPTQGHFDFTLVDSMIIGARQNDLHLVLLWFGAWKNSMSCYAPAWIKTNQQKYERVNNSKGNGIEILSALSANNLNADRTAFAALMKHIREIDGAPQTVLMIQVENEIGMLTEAREYTATANEAFNAPVPAVLMNYLKKNKDQLVPEFKQLWSKNNFTTSGNWEHVFGKSLSTDEIFQAWQYATYTNAIAAAGKKEYNLPMYVNAALNYKNVEPGQYPSAGPLPHLMDIWQAGAPQINFLSPDFYNPYFRKYSDLYTRRNNPYFIPEIRFEPDDAAKVFSSIGHDKAFGFSPFSIESEMPGIASLVKSYTLLKQLTPLILKERKNTEGFLVDKTTPQQETVMNGYTIKVSHDNTLSWSPHGKDSVWTMGGGLIINIAPDEFIIAGTGIVATFSPADSIGSVGILSSDEGNFVNGNWVAGRRMNGDQDHQGRHVRIETGEWGIQRVRVYRYR